MRAEVLGGGSGVDDGCGWVRVVQVGFGEGVGDAAGSVQ